MLRDCPGCHNPVSQVASTAKPVQQGVTIWLPYQESRGGPAPGRYPFPNGATLVIYEPEERPASGEETRDARSPETESLGAPGGVEF
jgi:hypothetical protein